MSIQRISCVIGWAIVASTVHADLINDDFESYNTGAFPGGQWQDIFDRTVGSSAEAPTMLVVDTIDAHGNATKAVQTNHEPGTNGLYADIDESMFHSVQMDVRVDAMPSPNAGWAVGVGYSRYTGEGDVNANPQAVVYSWEGRFWNFFIAMGEGRPGVDLRMSGPRFDVGSWYTVSVDVNSETGVFAAFVYDGETGALRNFATHTYAQWDSSIDQFDSITFFDGGDENAPLQSQATIDNIVYTPSPAGMSSLIGAWIFATRRSRP